MPSKSEDMYMVPRLKFIYYNCYGKKICGFVDGSSGNFDIVKEKIDTSLFQEHLEQRVETIIYWIDEYGDEIDIVNQIDYENFLEKDMLHRYVRVGPKRATFPKTPVIKSNDDDTSTSSSSSNIHLNVQCNSCLLTPIVGFRYKCIQCINFNLCQDCEAKHEHADHMMIRMSKSIYHFGFTKNPSEADTGSHSASVTAQRDEAATDNASANSVATITTRNAYLKRVILEASARQRTAAAVSTSEAAGNAIRVAKREPINPSYQTTSTQQSSNKSNVTTTAPPTTLDGSQSKKTAMPAVEMRAVPVFKRKRRY